MAHYGRGATPLGASLARALSPARAGWTEPWSDPVTEW